MRIQVLGVGNAFASRYYNTSFLVESERRHLVDCPPCVLRLLSERGIDPAAIDDVIVTHIHGDHVAGLETLLLWKKYVQRRRVRVWTSAAVSRGLRDKIFPSFADTFTADLEEIVQTDFSDYAEVHELHPNAQTRLDKGFAVEFRENWHPTPTLGLRLVSDRGAVGISGDTCYRPSLLRTLREKGIIDAGRYEKLAGNWLWNCDLIYHEVERGHAGPHTAEKDLLALPPDVRRKIRLIHLSDGFVERELPAAQEGETVSFDAPGRVVIHAPVAQK
jgi:ribonuclease BN (tRNA processing enzyme)